MCCIMFLLLFFSFEKVLYHIYLLFMMDFVNQNFHIESKRHNIIYEDESIKNKKNFWV